MSDIPHGTLSGYSYWGCRCDACKEVKRADSKAYYEAKRGPKPERKPPKYATASERAAAWKRANPERAKEIEARHREKNREKRRAAALARYYRLMAEDPESIRKLRRDYAKTEKGALYNRGARHARRGAKPTPEALAYMAIIASDPCAYCGAPGGEVDHIVPITQGGDGDWLNLAPACRRCNASKNDRDLLGFLLEGAA